MSAASARHFQTRESERAVRRPRSEAATRAQRRDGARARSERRRRERHFARRRRDLLEDTGLALIFTLILISVTAGLGVVVLLEIPLGTALVASVIIPRVRRRRQSARARTVASRRR
jgi:hypothetical protein